MVKDQILRSVDKSLAEYLEERDLFQVNLNDVITVVDNYQAIHGKHPESSRLPTNITPETVTRQTATNPTGRKCFNCQKSGYISKYCPINPKSGTLFFGSQWNRF